MASARSFYHLGLDSIVAKSTALRTPLQAAVAQSDDEPGQVNCSGRALPRHALAGRFTVFTATLIGGDCPAGREIRGRGDICLHR